MSTYLYKPEPLPGPTQAQPGLTTDYVLVFKTTLRDWKDVRRFALVLDRSAGPGRWHVDLEDADKVLRIETNQLLPDQVIRLLREAGYGCEELPD